MNLFLSLSMTAFMGLVLFLPLWLESPWLMGGIIILSLPLNTPFWSLIHEAIHKNLHPHRAVNEWMGRCMALVFGASFEVLRFGHRMHHQYNREWESEFYDRQEPYIFAALQHYFKMLGGLYLTEVILTFLMALLRLRTSRALAQKIFPDPEHAQAAYRNLLSSEKIGLVRLDAFLIFSLYAASLWVYGALWPLCLLLIGGRALMISIMDNAYHYATPLDNSIPAKELRVPLLISRIILHFNHHATHHAHPGLSWSQLPLHHQRQGGVYHENFMRAVIAQFKGPLRR
ncbi:MAG: fatty acid desaturase [Alphaproteobacteria bacterium]|nr:fatty acid desaturase [Alphaproteobacteria bacterium]